jgi:hypothetical protein
LTSKDVRDVLRHRVGLWRQDQADRGYRFRAASGFRSQHRWGEEKPERDDSNDANTKSGKTEDRASGVGRLLRL